MSTNSTLQKSVVYQDSLTFSRQRTSDQSIQWLTDFQRFFATRNSRTHKMMSDIWKTEEGRSVSTQRDTSRTHIQVSQNEKNRKHESSKNKSTAASHLSSDSNHYNLHTLKLLKHINHHTTRTRKVHQRTRKVRPTLFPLTVETPTPQSNRSISISSTIWLWCDIYCNDNDYNQPTDQLTYPAEKYRRHCLSAFNKQGKHSNIQTTHLIMSRLFSTTLLWNI